MAQETFTKNVIDRAADILVDLFGKLQATGGPVEDKVSNQEQMAAYMELRGQPLVNPDWQELIRQHGEEEVSKYIGQMEARIRRMKPENVQAMEMANGNNNET